MIADFHGDLGLWVANSCSFVAALGVGYLALAAIVILQFKEEPRRADARAAAGLDPRAVVRRG